MRSYGLILGIEKLQSEIANDPHKAREVLAIVIKLCVLIRWSSLDLNILSEVDDKGEVRERCLVDAANAVINEVAKL